MQIEISQKDYDLLLKHIAIGSWVYGIMSDAVSSKYKVEAHQGDELIHKILKHCNNDKVKDIYEKRNIFTEEFTDMIAQDMTQYENYAIEDLTGIDIDEIEREIDTEMSNPLFIK